MLDLVLHVEQQNNAHIGYKEFHGAQSSASVRCSSKQLRNWVTLIKREACSRTESMFLVDDSNFYELGGNNKHHQSFVTTVQKRKALTISSSAVARDDL